MSPPSDDARWTAIEQRVAALEAHAAAAAGHDHDAGGAGQTGAGRGRAGALWALEELRRRTAGHGPAGEGSSGGAVMLVGTVATPLGPVEWQEGRVVDDLLDDTSLDALEAPAAVLAALGSPVRLLLLARVLRAAGGAATAADLTADAALGTSGQVYHHLRQLVAAGWLRSAARGRYTVPAERVVPLLVALALAGG